MIINSIIILSFALRFKLDVTLKQIYLESALFTYSSLILIPLFLRFLYSGSPRFMVSLLSLIGAITWSSIAVTFLTLYLFHFQYKSLLIISWLFNIVILSIIKVPWTRTLPYLPFTSKSNESSIGFTSKNYSRLFSLRPESKDLKSLLIGVISSIIAFLIIYYLLGYR